MSIAKNIKVLREHHNMSQNDLAKMLEVTDRAVSAWETGVKEPRIKNMRKIADLFDIPLPEIVSGDLEAYYKNKDSPAPAEAETEEKLSVKEVIDAFVKAGFVPQGQDLTDADLRFIIAMGEAFTRWFESKQDSA